jgi:hypothetical protein
MAEPGISIEGGSRPTPSNLPEDFDVSQREDVAKLRKHAVGLGGVLFLTVTGAAPISAMLFNTPIVVGFGQGAGAPAVMCVNVSCRQFVDADLASEVESYLAHEIDQNVAFGMSPAAAREAALRCAAVLLNSCDKSADDAAGHFYPGIGQIPPKRCSGH